MSKDSEISVEWGPEDAFPRPSMRLPDRLRHVLLRSSTVWLEIYIALNAILSGVSMLSPLWDVRQAADVVGPWLTWTLGLGNPAGGLAMLAVIAFGSRCWRSYGVLVLIGAMMAGGNAAMLLDNTLIGLADWPSLAKAALDFVLALLVAVRGIVRSGGRDDA